MGNSINAVIMSLLILSGLSMVFITVALKYGDASKERNKAVIVALITFISSTYAAFVHIPEIIDNDDSYELVDTHEFAEQDEYLTFNGQTISLYIKDKNNTEELMLNVDKVDFEKTENVFNINKYENRFNREKYVVNIPQDRWNIIKNR